MNGLESRQWQLPDQPASAYQNLSSTQASYVGSHELFSSPGLNRRRGTAVMILYEWNRKANRFINIVDVPAGCRGRTGDEKCQIDTAWHLRPQQLNRSIPIRGS
jgi:hypothetical protein